MQDFLTRYKHVMRNSSTLVNKTIEIRFLFINFFQVGKRDDRLLFIKAYIREWICFDYLRLFLFCFVCIFIFYKQLGCM